MSKKGWVEPCRKDDGFIMPDTLEWHDYHDVFDRFEIPTENYTCNLSESDLSVIDRFPLKPIEDFGFCPIPTFKMYKWPKQRKL